MPEQLSELGPELLEQMRAAMVVLTQTLASLLIVTMRQFKWLRRMFENKTQQMTLMITASLYAGMSIFFYFAAPTRIGFLASLVAGFAVGGSGAAQFALGEKSERRKNGGTT